MPHWDGWIFRFPKVRFIRSTTFVRYLAGVRALDEGGLSSPTSNLASIFIEQRPLRTHCPRWAIVKTTNFEFNISILLLEPRSRFDFQHRTLLAENWTPLEFSLNNVLCPRWTTILEIIIIGNFWWKSILQRISPRCLRQLSSLQGTGRKKRKLSWNFF